MHRLLAVTVFSSAFILLQVPFPPRAAAQAPISPVDKVPVDTKHFASLEQVVTAVTAALSKANSDINAQNATHPDKEPEPEIQSAEFDFQTVTTNETTGGFIVSVVTLEGEHERDVTSETDFTYAVPSPEAATAHLFGLPANLAFFNKWINAIKNKYTDIGKTQADKDLSNTLPAAIESAAANVRSVRKVSNPAGKDLTQRSYVITLTFAVKNTFTGGVDPSSLVLVAPELKYAHTKNYVQTIKLTFKDPEPKGQDKAPAGPTPANHPVLPEHAILSAREETLFQIAKSPKFSDALYKLDIEAGSRDAASKDVQEFLNVEGSNYLLA